jgi:hypothetical protein
VEVLLLGPILEDKLYTESAASTSKDLPPYAGIDDGFAVVLGRRGILQGDANQRTGTIHTRRGDERPV